MKRITSQYQIELLVRCGTEVYWSNKTYRVKMSANVFNIVHDNGYCESLVDSFGDMKDKCSEFFFDDVVLYGTVIKNERDLADLITRMRDEEVMIKCRKSHAMQKATSLEDKIKLSRHYNKEVRAAQDLCDYVSLHYWTFVDML